MGTVDLGRFARIAFQSNQSPGFTRLFRNDKFAVAAFTQKNRVARTDPLEGSCNGAQRMALVSLMSVVARGRNIPIGRSRC